MNARLASRVLLAAFFISAGVNHFRSPEIYTSMMPPWLPAPSLLNQISGFAEIAGGIGILNAKTRRAAATGLVILLIAIFPANIHVAVNGWPGMETPGWILYARLPLQFLLIAWVVFSARNFRKPVPSHGAAAEM